MVLQLFDLAMLEPDRCFCCSSMHGLTNHVASKKKSCWCHQVFCSFISMSLLGMQVEDFAGESMRASGNLHDDLTKTTTEVMFKSIIYLLTHLPTQPYFLCHIRMQTFCLRTSNLFLLLFHILESQQRLWKRLLTILFFI